MALEQSPLPRLPCEGLSPRRASPSFWAVWHRSRGLCHSHSPRNPQHHSQRRSVTQGCAGLLGGPPPWGPRTCGKSFQGLRGRDPDSAQPFAAGLCGCHLSGPGFSRCRRALARTAPSQSGTNLSVREGASPRAGQALTGGQGWRQRSKRSSETYGVGRGGAGGTCWPENRSGLRNSLQQTGGGTGQCSHWWGHN